MSILNDIKGLFLPPVCPVCGGELHEGEGAFCMMCRTLAPQTGFWRRADNPLAERLRNEFPVVQASAFLWFVAGSPWQRAIHGFKYYNRWRTARDLGAWYGGNLADSGLYGSVDCIVPVPLHTRRLLARGYNQAAYIAEGIASRMGVPVEDRAVSRLRNNPSQTTRSSAGRWENVRDLFAVARPGALAGRHVLLVDDGGFRKTYTFRHMLANEIRVAPPSCGARLSGQHCCTGRFAPPFRIGSVTSIE